MSTSDLTNRNGRRQFLTLTATGAAVTAAGYFGNQVQAQTPAAAKRSELDNCMMVMPEDIEGPYYFDPKLERVDITEGKQGIPLKLRIKMMSADCRPLVGARIDVWQADTLGIYSGFKDQGDSPNRNTPGAVDSRGTTYLRGTQFSSATGEVNFIGIYPGWYLGRTPHIHGKVYLNQKAVLNIQFYFPDALSEFIYQNAPLYRRKIQRDTLNFNDRFLERAKRSGFLDVKEMSDHYQASITVAVDSSRELPPPRPKVDLSTRPPMPDAPVYSPEDRIKHLVPNAS